MNVNSKYQNNQLNLKKKSLATIHFYNPFTPRLQNMYRRI